MPSPNCSATSPAAFRRSSYRPRPRPGRDYNSEDWLPLWAAAEEAGISLSFHIGTGADPKVFRGLGGAITNHVASFYPAQTTLCHLVASGVLDAHPDPAGLLRRVRWFLAAGGHGAHGRGAAAVRHLVPAAAAADAAERVRQAAGTRELPARPGVLSVQDICGVDALMWGSDYPHLEGTYPNTRKVLDSIFDGVPDDVRKAITGGNFAKLFRVPEPSAG